MLIYTLQAPWDVRSDIFKNIEVGTAIIKDRLEAFDDADTKTVVTSKSFRGLNVRKKDKRKIKHTLFKQSTSISHQRTTKSYKIQSILCF